MAQLWRSLRASPSGQTRAIQFISARGGEGASTVAREFARHALAETRKSVWLVDLDLMDTHQHDAIARAKGRYGALGRQTAASPDGSSFFTVQPPAKGDGGRPVDDARFLVAYPVGDARLWVTRFRGENLGHRQTVHILPTGDYWSALRRHAGLIVVDSPAADRSTAGLTVAPFMDFTIIVLAADEADTAAPAALKQAINAAGGRCAGLVLNRASAEPPRFLKSILP